MFNNQIKKRPIRLECHVLREILDYLSILSCCRFWRANTGGATFKSKSGRESFVRFGVSGMPDIQGFMSDGRALFIEVKRPGGKLSQKQADFLKSAQQFNTIAFCADSVETVIERLRAEGYLA